MNVVITGSTKGIGLGMAREFLRRGHSIVVSSRGQAAVDAAMRELQQEFPAERIAGQPCDVSHRDQVQALWDKAVAAFGTVDCWINNAGRDGQQEYFHELPPEDYVSTVNTNLIGVMHCNHVALNGMHAQGSGTIWNMEGFGSNGQTMAKYGPYGTTKYGLKYFTKVLAKECKDKTVNVCFLSPGMVVTDMLIPQEMRNSPEWPKKRGIYNILADTVDVVTPWLVDNILANHGKNGAAVRWLTTPKVIWRFLTAKITGRDILTPLGL
ncbi:MAG: SDR family oxidoreductase [Gammaproteobacteria bacterium]|nr:SDR family oxidoreductase [Gammaproteobacteria bacterium]NND53607.1 SDR family oxidoreductase [Gammaproteobacteria bacterium]